MSLDLNSFMDEIYKTIVVGIYTRDGRKLQQESFENANEVNLNLQLLKGYYVVQISADGTLRSLPVLKL